MAEIKKPTENETMSKGKISSYHEKENELITEDEKINKLNFVPEIQKEKGEIIHNTEISNKNSYKKDSLFEEKKNNNEDLSQKGIVESRYSSIKKNSIFHDNNNFTESKSKEISEKKNNENITNKQYFQKNNNNNLNSNTNDEINNENLKEDENRDLKKGKLMNIQNNFDKDNNISFTNISNNRASDFSNNDLNKNYNNNFNNISNVNNVNLNTNSTLNVNYYNYKFENLAQRSINQNNFNFNFQKKKEFDLTIGEVKRIFKIFKIIAEGEKQVELVRQILSEISRFDPFATFKYFDEDGKNYLIKNDFQNYLK